MGRKASLDQITKDSLAPKWLFLLNWLIRFLAKLFYCVLFLFFKKCTNCQGKTQVVDWHLVKQRTSVVLRILWDWAMGDIRSRNIRRLSSNTWETFKKAEGLTAYTTALLPIPLGGSWWPYASCSFCIRNPSSMKSLNPVTPTSKQRGTSWSSRGSLFRDTNPKLDFL